MDGAYAALVVATHRAIAVNHAKRQFVIAVLNASLGSVTVIAAPPADKIFVPAINVLNARTG